MVGSPARRQSHILECHQQTLSLHKGKRQVHTTCQQKQSNHYSALCNERNTKELSMAARGVTTRSLHSGPPVLTSTSSHMHSTTSCLLFLSTFIASFINRLHSYIEVEIRRQTWVGVMRVTIPYDLRHFVGHLVYQSFGKLADSLVVILKTIESMLITKHSVTVNSQKMMLKETGKLSFLHNSRSEIQMKTF